MKRISKTIPNLLLIPVIIILVLVILDKGNLLRINDGIENILWSIIFPTFLIISLVLFVWASRSSKLYRELQKEISSKILRFASGALLVVLPAIVLVTMAGTVLGIYVNLTATSPIVLVIDGFRIRPNFEQYGTCESEIELYTNHPLCIKRSFGLPAIKTKALTGESGSLCVKGRENSVGTVVDQITIIPNEGLNMDAKQLRCAQLFGDT
jgi:hypothetical protein